MMHQFHHSILRAYDIRGIVGETLSTKDAFALGRAFATTLIRKRGRSVGVARDGRKSSPDLEAALIEGLVASGAEVVQLGLGPTPMLYFGVKDLGLDAGVMVTGSHNPPTHNGFKMVMLDTPYYGDDITALGKLAAAGDFENQTGNARAHDIRESYTARLAADYKSTQGLKVVWDAGNGAAGEILTALVKKLPGEHHCLFADIDGNFPNHHPDPTVPENLIDLQNKVAEINADLGIAFDGDGDRIGVIDRRGRIVWGDQLLAILSRDILSRLPGATIIADVKASQVLFDEVTRLGGKPLMWRTGHSLIKSKMKETGAPIAGEMSGHMFFADGYYGFDDGLYCGVRLLNDLANSGDDLAALLDALPKVVNTPEMRIAVDDR
ncbi:MAG TPA: phosphomannomutase, partial [Rhodospirillaceae bacterium]|nr:phosphomannomutase [Rhodospirillaceae bacterium]